MKMDMLCLLASVGDQKSILYLQLSFCLLRPYSAAKSHSLDVNLMTDLVDLSFRLGQQFIHDHEVASAVLDILPRLAAHITHFSTPKSKLTALLNSYRTAVQEDAFGPPVEAAYYRCIASLDSQWVWTDGGSKVALDLLEGLNRPLFSTVICSSRLIRQLFDTDIWSSVYQDLTMGALTSFFDSEAEGEQLPMRPAVIFQALSSIAVKSTWAEKPTLVMMLRFARSNDDKNALGLLRQALELVASRSLPRAEDDYSAWMYSRLEFLLDRWLPFNELEDFPYSLYNCTSSKQFVKDYGSSIAPIFFLKVEDPSKIARAAELAGSPSGSDWFSEHLPAILSKILPPISELLQSQLHSSASNFNRLAQTKLQDIQRMDKTIICCSLQNGLKDMFLRLLSSIQDSMLTSRLFGSFEVLLPSPGSFRHNKSAVLEAMRHFSPALIAGENQDSLIPQRPFNSLLTYFSSKPWDVHDLLVDLYCAYNSAFRSSDRLQALISISVTSELLTTALLPDEKLTIVLNYVFNSLVSWLGHILRDERTPEVVQHATLVIFQDLVKVDKFIFDLLLN